MKAKKGFRMPAEWESHEATWVAWPHNRTDWPGKFAPIPWVYGEIVRKVAAGELVRILVNSESHEMRARSIMRRAGVNPSKLEFFHILTNRGWMRDCGPIFVRRDKPRPEVAIIRFRFNGWAKYPDWKEDDAVSELAAFAIGARIFYARGSGCDVVLEGGSIEVNGRGTLLATEECLLDKTTQARNQDLSRQELESIFREYLGVTNVLWLGRGIAGDDTHGHIDDLCRFVGPRSVVICQEDNPKDVNYQPLMENRERLEGMRLEDGTKLEVVAIPMPEPLYFDGQRLPASYANFYISNAAVLVPTFNDPKDYLALGILAELFFDRQVAGVHAVDLIWGFGTIHCLTQQQPA